MGPSLEYVIMRFHCRSNCGHKNTQFTMQFSKIQHIYLDKLLQEVSLLSSTKSPTTLRSKPNFNHCLDQCIRICMLIMATTAAMKCRDSLLCNNQTIWAFSHCNPHCATQPWWLISAHHKWHGYHHYSFDSFGLAQDLQGTHHEGPFCNVNLPCISPEYYDGEVCDATVLNRYEPCNTTDDSSVFAYTLHKIKCWSFCPVAMKRKGNRKAWKFTFGNGNHRLLGHMYSPGDVMQVLKSAVKCHAINSFGQHLLHDRLGNQWLLL